MHKKIKNVLVGTGAILLSTGLILLIYGSPSPQKEQTYALNQLNTTFPEPAKNRQNKDKIAAYEQFTADSLKFNDPFQQQDFELMALGEKKVKNQSNLGHDSLLAALIIKQKKQDSLLNIQSLQSNNQKQPVKKIKPKASIKAQTQPALSTTRKPAKHKKSFSSTSSIQNTYDLSKEKQKVLSKNHDRGLVQTMVIGTHRINDGGIIRLRVLNDAAVGFTTFHKGDIVHAQGTRSGNSLQFYLKARGFNETDQQNESIKLIGQDYTGNTEFKISSKSLSKNQQDIDEDLSLVDPHNKTAQLTNGLRRITNRTSRINYVHIPDQTRIQFITQ